VTRMRCVRGTCVPVATAGPVKCVVTGVPVCFCGSGSYDTDGVIVSYQWAFQSQDGNAVLANPASVNPSFVPDVDGDYTISLVVNDGTDDSAADTVTITASGTIPIANAGADQNVSTGDTVTLDGSASFDPQGGTVTYLWAIDSQPGTATLSNVTAKFPTFVADEDGNYTISLVVNDGAFDSAPDTVVVTATASSAGSFAAGQAKYDAACAFCHAAGAYDVSSRSGAGDLYSDGELLIIAIGNISGMSGEPDLTPQELADLYVFLENIAP